MRRRKHHRYARTPVIYRPNPISTGTIVALAGGAALIGIGAYYLLKKPTATTSSSSTGTTPPALSSVNSPAATAQQNLNTAINAGGTAAAIATAQQDLVSALNAGTATCTQLTGIPFTADMIALLTPAGKTALANCIQLPSGT